VKKKTICGICPAGCWVQATLDSSGRLQKVEADPDSHLGMICKLGEHSPEVVYSKDRLTHPMKRVGPKGSFDFEPISWDEAYNIIVSKHLELKKQFGPESTAVYTGRGSFELAMCDIFQPKGVSVSSASSVLFPFGSPNTLGVGALCYVSFAMIAPHVTMGGMLINMFSDIENSELIVIWGANPATDCPPQDLGRIINAHKQGAKVVVIDPRKTELAKLSNAEWVPIRPGTDGAFALGLCAVLLEEELYDESFVTDWTVGFEEFASMVQHYRPEVVEEITGIPAETTRALARQISSANGASTVMYSGLEYSDSGVQAIRATHVLWAIAGQLDIPGGRCFTMSNNHFPINREGHIENPDVNKALGLDRFPVYSSYRGESHAIALPQSVLEGDPYKIRSLIILGGSLITSWPNPDLWKKTLNGLDFLVTIDRHLTADSAYADIVLPGTTMFEIESYMTYGPMFRIREKLIDPPGDARNDFFIMAELAQRLGYGECYPQSEEELLRHVLKGSGFSLEDVRAKEGMISVPSQMMEYKKWEKGKLRKNGSPGFDTPSGKFEIASSILEEHGYDPLPIYTEPGESPLSSPEIARDFPLVFNSGARVTTDFRTQHHGIKSLNKERPEPTVTINTQDALHRQIQHGDLVKVRSPRGEVKMRALVTDDIVQGAIDANMGGGGPVGPDAWKECNINELTDLDRFDPISGFPVYKSLLCEVALASSSTKVKIGQGEYTSDSSTGKSNQINHQAGVKRIYLDHNATTAMAKEVREKMINMLDHFGNPSGIYKEGKKARVIVEDARRSVAKLIHCTAKRIAFTAGGSEANNFAIKGIVYQNLNKTSHIITSCIEHPSVLNTCKQLETQGFKITYLPVDRDGLINPQDLQSAITLETCLISIMMANNETGAIQKIQELAKIARDKNILFHTDAVQAVGKIPVNVDLLGIDMLSMSGHKFHGPKGTGALYIRKGVSLTPLISGGSQENKQRAGTENLLGIIGLGRATELAEQHLNEGGRVQNLRDQLEKGIRKLVPKAKLNGPLNHRLPNTLNMILPGFRGESVVLDLDRRGIAISSGSACRSGSPEPSHALLAMGLSAYDAHCSIRISLGRENTLEEVNQTINTLKEMIEKSKNLVRFVPCR